MKMMRFVPFLLCALPMVAQTNSSSAIIERGAYLATVGGCGDCHTPKTASWKPDSTRLLAGAPSNAPAPSKPKRSRLRLGA